MFENFFSLLITAHGCFMIMTMLMRWILLQYIIVIMTSCYHHGDDDNRNDKNLDDDDDDDGGSKSNVSHKLIAKQGRKL